MCGCACVNDQGDSTHNLTDTHTHVQQNEDPRSSVSLLPTTMSNAEDILELQEFQRKRSELEK